MAETLTDTDADIDTDAEITAQIKSLQKSPTAAVSASAGAPCGAGARRQVYLRAAQITGFGVPSRGSLAAGTAQSARTWTRGG